MSNKNKRIIYICVLILAMIGSYTFGMRTNSMIGVISNIKNSESKESDGFKSDVLNKANSLKNIIDKEYLKDYNKKDLEDGIYKGMLESLKDPYSVYYNEKEYKALQENTEGKFGGIGVQVNGEGEYIEVVTPIKGTPGEKAGIKPLDKIISINGKPYKGKDLEKAVEVMRGKPGEAVNLTILRGEGKEAKTIDLKLVREIINVQSIHYKLLSNNIGYILMSGFQENTDEEFIKAVEELQKLGAKKLILDLRNNPGGLLDTTMKIADYLLDKKTVITVNYKNREPEVLTTKDGKNAIPMVVLINEGSASASEVLSGALKENGRAKIVGVKSYGKGVIQQIYPVNNDGKKEGMKLTIGEFYTPKGNKIHGVGITPDEIVKIPEGVTKIGTDHLDKDTQLQRAIEILK